MAQRIDDRWLWFGLGLFLFAAAKGVYWAMHDLRELIRLDPDQYPPGKEDESHIEDSIKLETLRILTTHYNPNISRAAFSIVVSRFIRDPKCIAMLKEDFRSSDRETRRKAHHAVDLLFTNFNHTIPGLALGPSSSNTYCTTDPSPQTEMSEQEEVVESHPSSLVSSLQELEDDLNLQDPSVPVSLAGWNVLPSQRPPPTHSPEEAERRRRRREAMVLHEGAGRIDEHDIYRPAI